MKKKIVFILNSIQQQRCLKRIEEFLDNNYEVVVYGFRRSKVVPTVPRRFEVKVLADIPYGLSMMQRFRLMFNAVKPVIERYKKEDVIFYYFLLDVALVCCFLNKNKYIYENSDLMYGYFNKPLKIVFKALDKFIIKKSLLSVFTSGGFVDCLYDGKKPSNVIIIPNRINKAVLNLPYKDKEVDENHLIYSFVGFIRQPITKRFVEVLMEHFPQHEFHINGIIHEAHISEYEELARKYPNLHLNGAFSNPKDLPSIYEKVDIIVSAIGEESTENILYSEPNKLYECIYFRKPIIAPNIGYWGRKVKQLGIGFVLEDTTEDGIKKLIKNITKASIMEKKANIECIPQIDAVDDNPELFKMLEEEY